jgi:DNA gyrase subunit A
MADETETPPPETPRDNVTDIAIEQEMRRSYLDYAMSVIVSRALPDARDGLKPVHRRILFSMHENGYASDKAFRKSARVVGDVRGKYHPHGDQAIYDAMVRMAQPFAMRVMLVDGQGNFGSMDGDPPAAMRYTEVRLAKPAEALIGDIDKDTVDFQENYDGTSREPTVLPAQWPNLLVNGAGGIAVGMATNIPPHNLGEIIDACCALIDQPSLGLPELLEIVKGPDFPTAGLVLGRAGIRAAYHTGRGSVVMRAVAAVEEIRKDRWAIVVTEIPYQVNKSNMLERIAEAVRAKRIEGIAELRDESDREGVRVVFELKRDAMPEVTLNQLYRHSPLQTTFGVNMLALNRGRPELMSLRDLLSSFVEFREEVVTRRTRHLLTKARERAHTVAGLAIAVANIDEMIALIRSSPDAATARERMMARDWPADQVAALIELVDEPGHKVIDGKYRLSDAQARAILDIRLQRLTALGRDELAAEMAQLADSIRDYLDILENRSRLIGIVRSELVEMKERFATPRLTQILEDEFEVDDEALIAREDMVLTVTHAGYVSRVPLSTYRTQGRGGKGRLGMATREEDAVTQLFVVNTHTPLLFFSTLGRVYKLKAYRIPAGSPQSRGRAMLNLLPLQQGETIGTVLPLPEDEADWRSLYVMFATASGHVRRNSVEDFANIMSNGKIAMKLDEGDRIVGVALCGDQDDVLLAARGGKCIRFPVIDVRVFKGRESSGVRGMSLARSDEVISMTVLRHHELDVAEREAYLRWARGGDEAPKPARADELKAAEQFLLSVTEKGYGKRTSAYEYRITGRGGQGVINIDTSERNGPVVAAFPVEDRDEIMAVTEGGQMIRMAVADIRIAGRGTQGVTLVRTSDGDRVVSVARLPENGDDAPAAEAGGGPEPEAAEPSGGES